jgi:hypothetical protein
MISRSALWRVTLAALLLAGAALPAWPGQASSTKAAGLDIVATWTPFPTDTTSPGGLFPDSPRHVALALSDNSSTPNQQWTRAQLVSLSNGRPVGAAVPVPAFRVNPFFSPQWLDTQRQVFIYATPESSPLAAAPTNWDLVGLSLSGKAPKVVFRVATRFRLEGVVAMATDKAGRYLMMAATADHASSGQSLASGTGVDLDVVSIAALMHGQLQSPWASTYQVSKTDCPTLIATTHTPGMLWNGSTVYVGCRQANAFGTSLVTVNRTLSGVVRIDGLGAKQSGTVTTTFFPAPGNYEKSGEVIADAADSRLVLVDSSNGIGARVFDAAHDRYVGRTPLGLQIPAGYTVDSATGRFYVGSDDPAVGLATSDLRSLTPTQGLHAPDPWAAIFQQQSGQQLSFSFDPDARTLFIPVYNPAAAQRYPVYVVQDNTPAFVPSVPVNPDAGALDVAEKPGVTDSQRFADAQAYGADYQVIGGLADLQQNAGSGDQGADQRPGSNFLRQAEVGGATLSGDESTAIAVTGREDDVTNGYRQGIPNGGDQFAPAISCSDFGSSPTAKPTTSYTAFVDCNYTESRTHAGSSFVADRGVFITTGTSAPVASPVQVGASSVDIMETRAPHLGALSTTITAVASGVTLPGGVQIGNVTTVLTLTTHGRHGTASASREVTVSDVSVGKSAICAAACSTTTVKSAIEAAAPGRVHVDFPSAQKVASPGGAFAQIAQDPWFHAERVLDADKADTDVAVPAMAITVNLDGKTKSRLVVDLAAASASSSYRIFRLGDFGPAPIPGVAAPAQHPLLPTGLTTGPTPTTTQNTPAPQVASGGFVPTLAKAASIVFGSLGRMLELLPVFLLLGVPVYLSARRRLLLELPLLGREEETS